ncbi:class I SAM-dependent methyltransferase [Streptomyces sp. MS1.HAVA.3]|uniref:Class I SAM-dependent methyltransferase n=1 Tax=Streptomyces caledonius TaxID=3134107 RepID=A0ABU8TYP3_9ACTN
MTTPHLLPAHELERTSVVANNTMNRERGLAGVNSYARELGLDPVARLMARSATPSWLDLCSGEGHALREARPHLPAGAVLTGVDLVGPLVPAPAQAPDLAMPRPELLTASVAHWSPDRTYDLITCVHGLHYVGDQLGLLTRAASWLAPGSLLIAHLDPASLRWADGAPPAGPPWRRCAQPGSATARGTTGSPSTARAPSGSPSATSARTRPQDPTTPVSRPWAPTTRPFMWRPRCLLSRVPTWHTRSR